MTNNLDFLENRNSLTCSPKRRITSCERIAGFSKIVRSELSKDISSSSDNVETIVVKMESDRSKTKTSIRLFEVNSDDKVDNLY